jgi:hypothetical protein
MAAHNDQQNEKVATWFLLGIGLLLIGIALFLDPIGSSPRTGLFDLGIVGTKWLLGIFGLIFFVPGIIGLLKKR